MSTILVVDDKEGGRKVLRGYLGKAGYNIIEAADEDAAIECLKTGSIDLILTDVRMKKPDGGMEVLKVARAEYSDLPVILITAYGLIPQAVQAMREGAEDYIERPFNREALKARIEKALQKGHLVQENRFLRKELRLDGDFGDIIGESEKLRSVLGIVRKVSRSDAAVLIRGESGTGKDLIAQAIHNNSNRSDKPFIRTECAVYAEGVLESELFGHEKGSFTGAAQNRMGRFELADGGTIFLDEIGDISPATQLKLLRVVQDKVFERVGGSTPIEVDVRIIAATNKNLEEAIDKGTFREDLYYRINVVPIYVPPLRERKEDIPKLTKHFMDKFSGKVSNRIKDISPEAMELLMSYNWRGNVRELENAIERAMVLADDDIILSDHLPLPPGMGLSQAEQKAIPGTGKLTDQLDAFERQLILDALKQHNWVRSKTATALGLKRPTLNYKMARLGIDPPEESES